MLEFFKTGDLDTISLSMETLLGSILDGDEDIRLEDTEYAGPILIQLSFRNARGEPLFTRTVDYQMTVRELYEKVVAWAGPFPFILCPLMKAYGPPSSKMTGDCDNTATLDDIFKMIEQMKIIQPHHKLLEWSINRCDYRYTCAAAEKAGFTHLMPPVENSICCIRPLRRAMPGLFSFSLPILFYMIDPKSPLVMRAHVADVDTLIFFRVKIILALMYFGRKDEFLPYWEKYYEESGGWTEIFFKERTEKQTKAQPDSSALTLSTVSSKKRSLESAGNSNISKKAKTQSNKSKLQPKKAKIQPGKNKTPTKKGASGSGPRKSPPISLANQKKQGPPVVQDPSSDQQEASLPTARQSSRTKGKLPQYREESDGDDSDGSPFTGDEADDEST